MINWTGIKEVNNKIINNNILSCIKSRQFTNNGIFVRQLQNKIKNIFKIENNKEVLMVCNGAMGINALIGGLNTYFNKKLKWAVQSFTFPCSHQGLLCDSIILDIDENMGPNIQKLVEIINNFDGLLITNCFGCSVNIDLYVSFCKKYNKLLLFDNAASPLTYYNGINHLNYGDGCMVSLHHTKPIGFGEGGFIVFNKKYIEIMENTICFGYTKTNKYNYDINAGNYKMSELNAIYIDNYLNNLKHIFDHHTDMIKYFIQKITNNKLDSKFKLFTNYADYNTSLLSSIPLIFNKQISLDPFLLNNIEAKKYYYPLDINSVNSKKLFDNIICLPLTLDTTYLIIDIYINILLTI